ncbi:MAG: VanZ family protein, partial [Blautia sp.]
RVMLLGFSFSLLVECTQLVTRVGTFDVDDLMLNTLGAVIGYLFFALCDRIRRHIYG